MELWSYGVMELWSYGVMELWTGLNETMDKKTELPGLVRDWTKAEKSADSSRLQELLTEDFQV